MLKIGIIGMGHMGNYHASVCMISQVTELIAISDPNQENLKKVKSSKVKKSKDYNEWLHLVEAVVIAVPTELHYDIAKNCLEKGVHVLVEKPITRNVKQAEELFNIAEKNNLALHIGHVERFNGAVQELKKIIHQPYLVESHRIGPFVPRVQKDSVILDLMIHDLDLIINIMNSEVEDINVIAKSIKTKLPDIAVVQLKFKNGSIANITSSRASQIKQRTMSIHQKDSYIKLDFTTQDIFIHRHTSDSVVVGTNQLQYKQEGTIERLFVYKDNPLKQEIEHFAKSIKTGKKLRNAKKDITALKLTLKLEEKVCKSNA